MKEEDDTISPSLSVMSQISLRGAWTVAGVSVSCLSLICHPLAPTAVPEKEAASFIPGGGRWASSQHGRGLRLKTP